MFVNDTPCSIWLRGMQASCSPHASVALFPKDFMRMAVSDMLLACSFSKIAICSLSSDIVQVAKSEDARKSSAVSALFALKIQSPSCPWEFYICKVLQGRVPPASRSLFLAADMLYLSPTHSGMLTPCGKRGTLQDLLNAYMRKGKVGHFV